MELGIKRFGRISLEDRGAAGLFRLRLVQLFSYFVIVVTAKYFVNFEYNSDLILLVFCSAAVLQFYCRDMWQLIGGRCNWKRSKIDASILVQSSYLDLIVVLSLIYLTGTIESPFLLLLTVPLFFASYTFSSKITISSLFGTAIIAIATLGCMEVQGIIPHHASFSPTRNIFLDGPYYVGSLLVLGAILALVLYLSYAFQDKIQFNVSRLQKIGRESEERIVELARLYDISLGVNSVMTLDTLLKIIAKEATMLLSQPWSGIVLFNSEQELTHATFVGVKPDIDLVLKKRMGQPRFSQWARGLKSVLAVRDTRECQFAQDCACFAENEMFSMICCPLASGQQIFGLLIAGDFKPKMFEQKYKRLITILCDQLSVAIEKSRLYESLERKIRSLNEKLENQQKSSALKSEFVSHVSHELRTPLTSIKAYIEALCTHGTEPDFPQRAQFLEIVSKETNRLIRIVNGILDVSKIEFGQRPLQKKSIDLERLARDAILALKPSLDEKKLRIVSSVSKNLPMVDADEDLMKEVFINLINNAAKYSEENTTITVTAEEGAVDVSVSIQDEGIGIPTTEINKIFDKYFRVRSESSKKNEGVGLGLAIVKNIIEKHGGAISVTSEENIGSKFTFTIPKKHCYNDLLGYIAEVINAKGELREMLDLIVRMIAELISAKTVSLMLLDSKRSELFIKVSYGLSEWVVEQARVKVGEGISGKVVESGQPIFIDNIEQNEIYACPNNPQYETTSLISIPLFVNDVVVGVINVNNKTNGMPFTKDDMSLLISFGDRISKALERVRFQDETCQSLNETIEAFKKMLDAQMRTGVIEKIIDQAVRISRKLNLNEKEVSVIQYVASVHDIGMTKISDEILSKTLNLTSEELGQIQKHPQQSNDLIRPLEFVELVSKIILYHHERMDGLGYPMGLKGEEIPIGARILAVIDAYQSMTVTRVYRKRLTSEEAAKELVENADKQFDIDVVRAFLQVLREDNKISSDRASDFDLMLRGKISSKVY
jgi:K+-sensing histidine kinase KdpD